MFEWFIYSFNILIIASKGKLLVWTFIVSYRLLILMEVSIFIITFQVLDLFSFIVYTLGLFPVIESVCYSWFNFTIIIYLTFTITITTINIVEFLPEGNTELDMHKTSTGTARTREKAVSGGMYVRVQVRTWDIAQVYQCHLAISGWQGSEYLTSLHLRLRPRPCGCLRPGCRSQGVGCGCGTR